MTSSEEWLNRFENLRQWQRQGERSPHKPLLVLLALGDLMQGKERMHSFPDIDKRLGSLLRRFGPPRRPSPEHPFSRLANDEVWETPGIESYQASQGNHTPLRSELMAGPVRGGFPEELYDLLVKDPSLISEVAMGLLEKNFPQSMHEEILEAVPLELSVTRRLARDSTFRPRVLQAYQERCAICHLDTRMDGVPFLLDAAHIMWHNMHGPDSVDNGLALCVLHHRAFDRGAMGLTDDHRILVSAGAIGGQTHNEALLRHHGERILFPYDEAMLPRREHIQWHTTQVFRAPARPI